MYAFYVDKTHRLCFKTFWVADVLRKLSFASVSKPKGALSAKPKPKKGTATKKRSCANCLVPHCHPLEASKCSSLFFLFFKA